MFARPHETVEETMERVFDRDLPQTLKTLDAYAGRALGHATPFAGFCLQGVNDRDARLSHSGIVYSDRIVPLCLERSIPVLDTRSVSQEARFELAVCGPMLAVGSYDFDGPLMGTGALSHLPTAAYCALWTARGAILHGEPYDLRLPDRPVPGGRTFLE